MASEHDVCYEDMSLILTLRICVTPAVSPIPSTPPTITVIVPTSSPVVVVVVTVPVVLTLILTVLLIGKQQLIGVRRQRAPH